jgi:hypothetical protein
MNLYIPEIGDTIKLSEDWKFKLHHESRNTKFAEILGYTSNVLPVGYTGNTHWRERGFTPENEVIVDPNNRWNITSKLIYNTLPIVLEKGTVLIIDRIYIRKGAKDYSSITFRIESCDNKKLNKKRFWVKLKDANNIEFNEQGVTKSVSLHWDSFRYGASNYEAIMEKSYSYSSHKPNQVGFGYIDKLFGDKRFQVMRAQEMREATIEEHVNYLASNQGRSRFLSKKVKREDLVFREKAKYTLIDIKTNVTIGTWGTMETIKTKARKILKEEL